MNIEAHWDGDTFGDNGGRTSIVSLPPLATNSWYRLRATFTKISPTSARIAVSLRTLNSSGSEGEVVASGSILNTSLLPNTAENEIPNSGYFTAALMWTAFKNHNGTLGDADNAYFEIVYAGPLPPGVTFAAFADYGSDSTGERRVADLVKSWNPDLIITGGDNLYSPTSIDNAIGKYYSDFIGNYHGNWGSGSSTNRFFPAIGNHDYTEGGGWADYQAYFTLPGNERYYDFVRGPIHFFAIDSNPAGIGAAPGDGRSPTSVQGNWLRNGLAAPLALKIVYASWSYSCVLSMVPTCHTMAL
jgi:hypothetical protein